MTRRRRTATQRTATDRSLDLGPRARVAERSRGRYSSTVARKPPDETWESVRSEAEARERIEELNARIARMNAMSISGPPTTVAPMDVEQELRRWRAAVKC